MRSRSKTILSITSLFIFVSALLIGCSGSKDDGGKVESNTPKNQKSQDSSTGAGATKPPVNSSSTAATTKPGTAAAANATSPAKTNKTPVDVSQMLVIFPKEQNMEWRYTDSKAFGFKMRALNLSDADGGKVLNCIGRFRDSVPNGKGVDFTSEYYIYPDGIKEALKTAINVFPNPIKEMMIIKGPLEKNTYWEQDVKIDGVKAEVKLEGKIFDVINDGGKKVYQVRYAAKVDGYPNNIYMEERHYKEGSGLINYSFIDKAGKVTNYSMEKMVVYIQPKK